MGVVGQGVCVGVAVVVAAVVYMGVGDTVHAQDSCAASTRSHLVDGVPDERGWVKPHGADLFGTAGDALVNEMNAQNIEANLRYLTQTAQMAGTKQDLEQAKVLQKSWLEHGLDSVVLKPYHVQLSHPDLAKPNKVFLLDEAGQVKFTSQVMEESLPGQPFDQSVPPAFLAFGPAGVVEASELVYVNYGSFADFEEVERRGIKVEGRVVIAKFAGSFRGDKVQNAQRFNASAILLYTDPSDYHQDTDTPAYPNSLWLPGSGIQRGSILWHDGDPTTPGYPSIDGSYRVADADTDTPRIPAHCLSYNDARKLLVNMGGEEVPEAWRGKLNITYRMGPGLAREGWRIRVEVHNVRRIVPTYNVLGLVRGAEEPDRYVVLGNHRDSWTFGSCDPASATAVQMELARVLGTMVKGGWRPRRSIILGSWGAGEYGFFGPMEWVEEYLQVLGTRAVAHFNLDLAIMYNYNLEVDATPMLHHLIQEATKRVPAPVPSLGYTTLWDHWSSRNRFVEGMMGYNLGSISEHAVFYQKLGIPTSYMVWYIDPKAQDWSDYPLYHSAFEDFDVVKNLLDPDFAFHLSIARLWGLEAIGMADAKVLPLDPADVHVMMAQVVHGLRHEYGSALDLHHVSLEWVDKAVEQFRVEAQLFKQRLEHMDHITPLQARQLNDQLLLVERSFLDSEGSPLRPHMKNMVLGPDNFNQYASWLAPGVRDALWEATQCEKRCDASQANETRVEDGRCPECSGWWETVKQQVSVLAYVFNAAGLALKPVHEL